MQFTWKPSTVYVVTSNSLHGNHSAEMIATQHRGRASAVPAMPVAKTMGTNCLLITYELRTVASETIVTVTFRTCSNVHLGIGQLNLQQFHTESCMVYVHHRNSIRNTS